MDESTQSGFGTSGSEPTPRGDAVYVVQTEDGLLWKDIATVTVPAKTKRKTVIARAVEQAGDALKLGPTTSVVLRVIPAEHAEKIKVEMEQPPPQLRIGGR